MLSCPSSCIHRVDSPNFAGPFTLEKARVFLGQFMIDMGSDLYVRLLFKVLPAFRASLQSRTCVPLSARPHPREKVELFVSLYADIETRCVWSKIPLSRARRVGTLMKRRAILGYGGELHMTRDCEYHAVGAGLFRKLVNVRSQIDFEYPCVV